MSASPLPAHEDEPMTYPSGTPYVYNGQLMIDGKAVGLTVATTSGADCCTLDQKLTERIVDLETAVSLLTTEVEHLREDLARVANKMGTL